MARRLGYDFSRIKRVRRREFDRKPLNLKAEIEIYLKNGDLFSSGHATIKDISPNGAFLKGLHLSKNVLPIKPFVINLRILEGNLKDLKAKGEIVRFENSRYIKIGIHFLEVDETNRERLINLVA